MNFEEKNVDFFFLCSRHKCQSHGILGLHAWQGCQLTAVRFTVEKIDRYIFVFKKGLYLRIIQILKAKLIEVETPLAVEPIAIGRRVLGVH